MLNKTKVRLLAGLIVIGLCVSFFAIYNRILIEQNNKNVEITVDYRDVERLSAMDGVTPSNLLSKMKSVGVISVALPEELLSTLESVGRITISTGAELSDSDIENISSHYLYIMSKDKVLLRRIKNELSLILGDKQVRLIKDADIIEVRDGIDELLGIGIGVFPNVSKMLAKQGFRIIPRLYNNYRYNANKINTKLNYVKALMPADTIIFGGMQVLGYKYHIPEAASQLKSHNIRLGAIEFSKQKGDDNLVYLMNDFVTRVHSIGEEEMEEEMTRPKAIARFKRAVVERGVNLLYVRPFYMMEPNKTVTQTNVDYICDLRNSLIQAGYKVGPAIHPKDLKMTSWQIILLSVAACSALIILLSYFIAIPDIATGLLLVLTIICSYLSARMQIPYFWRGFMALSVACTFPTLSLIYLFQPKSGEASSDFISISKIIIKLISAFAITFIGVILIVGLLADVQYMLGARVFSGIKVAMLVPILMISVYFFFLFPKTAGKRVDFKQMIDNTKAWFNIPITVGYVFVGIVILAAGILYILRSGNFSMGVLGIESKFRGLLEWLFAVRPRTKEFMVGYPFLVFGSYYYLKGGRSWLWLFLVIGSISLISLTNTFCHVHSPLLLSTIRSFYGLILGIFVGLILLGIYNLAVMIVRKKLS